MDADSAEHIVIDDEPDCERAVRVDRGDVRYTLTTGPRPQADVAYARFPPAEVESRAALVIGTFRDLGSPFRWSIGPLTDAPGLATILAASGLRRERDALIVTAPLPMRGRQPDHDLELVEETDERTARDGLRVDRDLSGSELDRLTGERAGYLACGGRRGGGVVAYRRGIPVGYGRWRYGTDGLSVYLSHAHTLRPHRRTGVYTAILGYRIDRAVRHGRTVAVASVDRGTIAPILMRKGFREVASVTTWAGA